MLVTTLFSCKLGDPEPDVTWLRNGKEIKVKKKDKRIKIDWDMKTDEYTLEIQNASKDDIGEYTAVAKNVKGTITVLITVTFKVKKEAKKEVKKKEEKQKEVVEETVEIGETKLPESKAPPVEEKCVKDSETVVKEDVAAEEREKVQEKPKEDEKKVIEGKPSFVKQPENIQIEEGETIRLVCQVKGMIIGKCHYFSQRFLPVKTQ